MKPLSATEAIAAIEAGIQRNGKPLWSGAGATGMPYNRKSGKTYSGVNVLMLWMAAQEAGYSTAAWLTFKQARELGGSIKKGSTGVQVVYFSTVEHETTNRDTGEVSMVSDDGFNYLMGVYGVPKSKPKFAGRVGGQWTIARWKNM